MKGILLAGGSGSRLMPITAGASKQLLPIYDKPLLYYPLSVLIQAGIREILVISTPHDLPMIERLLGTGEQWGIHLQYSNQSSPKGIAEAFLIGESFIGNDSCCLILGDNLFFGSEFDRKIASLDHQQGATVFAYHVKDPERYGVINFDENDQPVTIVEKPKNPTSHYAVTGLYFYDNDVVAIAKNLKPSPRGELEISHINEAYLKRGDLQAVKLGRGVAWMDAGTHDSLLDCGNLVRTLQQRQNLLIGSPGDAAFKRGFINATQLSALAHLSKSSGYGKCLQEVVDAIY